MAEHGVLRSTEIVWASIVDGPARDTARARVLEIVHVTGDLVRHLDGWSRSLAGGMAGVAIFLNYLPDGIRSQDTQRQALRLLTESLRGTCSSFQGFAGRKSRLWQSSLEVCGGIPIS